MALMKQKVQEEDIMPHGKTGRRRCRKCRKTFTYILSGGAVTCDECVRKLAAVFWAEWDKTHKRR